MERWLMQLTLQSVLPCSLQMVMENLPKLARTKWITSPCSQLKVRLERSHAYAVR